MEPQIWAFSLCATKETDGEVIISHGICLGRAYREEEAIGNAYLQLEKKNPKEDGWRDYSIARDMVPAEWYERIRED